MKRLVSHIARITAFLFLVVSLTQCGEFNTRGTYLGYLEDLLQTESTAISNGSFTLVYAGGNTTEAGGTTTFTLALAALPTANVTITLTVSDTTEASISCDGFIYGSTCNLTFTPLDWFSPQTVTIQGLDDIYVDGDQSFTVVLDPAVSTDTVYNGKDPGDVALLNTDNESSSPWADPDGGTCFTYRRKITFGTSHSLLYTGYTATVVKDTKATGNVLMTASGDDVRIVWQPTAGAAQDLNRIGDIWNKPDTNIKFRLQSDIPANADEATDGSYFVYYGCATAATPLSDEFYVYYFADFFDRADNTDLNASTAGTRNWVEWDMDGGQIVDILSGSMRIFPTTDLNSVGAYYDLPLGAIPDDFVLEFDWDIMAPGSNDGGESTWFSSVVLGDSTSLTGGNNDLSTGVGPGLYSCEDASDIFCSSATTYNINNRPNSFSTIEATVKGNHTFTLTVDQTAKNYVYARGGTPGGTYSYVNSLSTLDRIRFMMYDFGMDPDSEYFLVDNLKIYLDPATAPTLTLGSEEQKVP